MVKMSGGILFQLSGQISDRAPLERAGLEDDACELVLERADRGIPSATNAAGTGSATLA
jgi:hypothetical protein